MTNIRSFQGIHEEIAYIFSLDLSIIAKFMLSALKFIEISSFQAGQKSPVVARDLPASLSYDVEDEGPILERFDIKNVAVIPVYVRNEKESNQILRAVSSVSKQIDAVIVVNDGSPFPLPQLQSANSHIINLTCNSGPAVARNVGLSISKRLGNVENVLFLDADCVATESWANEMTQRLSEKAVVAGLTKSLSNGKDYVSLYHDVFGTLNGRSFQGSKDNLLYATTCNFGINLPKVSNLSTTEILFDPSFPNAAFEDVEFCARLRKSNISIFHEPKAVMHHDYDTSWKGFVNQFKKYGKSESLFISRHPEYHSWASESKMISSFA